MAGQSRAVQVCGGVTPFVLYHGLFSGGGCAIFCVVLF